MDGYAYEDALEDLARGDVPLLTPIPEERGGGIQRAAWHPGEMDGEMIHSDNVIDRGIFCVIMLNEHRRKNGFPCVDIVGQQETHGG
jgi:hypothetical protein